MVVMGGYGRHWHRRIIQGKKWERRVGEKVQEGIAKAMGHLKGGIETEYSRSFLTYTHIWRP